MKATDTSFIVQISRHRAAIMGISILSIMLFHQYFTSIVPFNLFHVFGYWGVDVFLFLSGMGLVNSLRRNSIGTYYKRRFTRLAPSCLLCGSLKYAIFIAFSSSLGVLAEGLHLGPWSVASLDLWFIYAIIIFYSVSPVLYHSLIKWPYLSGLVILCIFIVNELTIRLEVGFEWMTPTGVMAWTIDRLPVFAAGMMVAIRKWTVGRKTPLSLVFLLMAMGLTLLHKTHLSFYGLGACQGLCVLLGMPALILLCIMMLNFVPQLLYRVFVFLGNHSLELYLVHEFIFFALQISCEQVNPYCLLALGFMLSCLSAYITKLAVNKIMPQ